jgi:hypothetical protein
VYVSWSSSSTYGGDSGNGIFVLYWRCSLIRVSVIRGSTVSSFNNNETSFITYNSNSLHFCDKPHIILFCGLHSCACFGLNKPSSGVSITKGSRMYMNINTLFHYICETDLHKM